MDIGIEFERECYKCYGTGGCYTGKGCDNCANTGRVATSLGDELMEFLKNQKQRDAAKEAEKREK